MGITTMTISALAAIATLHVGGFFALSNFYKRDERDERDERKSREVKLVPRLDNLVMANATTFNIF